MQVLRVDQVHVKEEPLSRTQLWWDHYFLRLARLTATASKDPSTRVGAVIVDPERRVVSTGYNGAARGVRDDPERLADRDTRLRITIHAEVNAILFARRDLADCVLYTFPFAPCSPCAAVVVQTGICRVVAPPTPPPLAARWGADLALAAEQFRDAGVTLDLIDLPLED